MMVGLGNLLRSEVCSVVSPGNSTSKSLRPFKVKVTLHVEVFLHLSVAVYLLTQVSLSAVVVVFWRLEVSLVPVLPHHFGRNNPTITNPGNTPV